jgi:glyoxalase family protein
MRTVTGLHHITAISGPAQENLDFYAGLLGMRLVKRSVNQDDPSTDHLFLRRRRREPGHRPDLLPLAPDGPAAPWPWNGPRGLARGRSTRTRRSEASGR